MTILLSQAKPTSIAAMALIKTLSIRPTPFSLSHLWLRMELPPFDIHPPCPPTVCLTWLLLRRDIIEPPSWRNPARQDAGSGPLLTIKFGILSYSAVASSCAREPNPLQTSAGRTQSEGIDLFGLWGLGLLSFHISPDALSKSCLKSLLFPSKIR